MSAALVVGRIPTLFPGLGPTIRWFWQEAGHRFFLR